MAPKAPRFSSSSCHAEIPILLQPLGHQGEEGPQSGSVGWGGVELHSGGKQCCLIKTLKALCLAFSCLSLAFSRLSCSVSFLICSVSLSICFVLSSICSLSLLTRKISLSISFIRCSASLSFCLERCLICSISSSIPRTGRQLRVDKNDRHRGSDEGDAPLLLEADAAAEDGDVVIGRKKSDQAEKQTAAGLDGTEVIQAGPGALWCW
jgi:hypothetical protein